MAHLLLRLLTLLLKVVFLLLLLLRCRGTFFTEFLGWEARVSRRNPVATSTTSESRNLDVTKFGPRGRANAGDLALDAGVDALCAADGGLCIGLRPMLTAVAL